MLQDPGFRSKPESLNHLLADEFVEFSSTGQIFDKPEILKSISEQAPTIYEMEEFKVDLIKPGLVLATYVVTRKSTHGDGSAVSLRSSLWVERAGGWQMLFHQGTIIPPQASQPMG